MSTVRLLSRSGPPFRGHIMHDPNRKDRRWWQRAALGALLMVGANLVPLWLTWEDWQTDGVESLGWPFTFWEFGGIGGNTAISLRTSVLDLIIALLVAGVFANATSGGLTATIDRLRTWPRHH